MSHYSDYREEEAYQQLEQQRESRVECSTLALSSLAELRSDVLVAYRRYGSRVPVPQYVQDAFDIIETFHKAQLHDHLPSTSRN